MPSVSTEFTAPCTQDRTILAVQDLANSLQWPILELGMSRVVLHGPRINQFQAVAPTVTVQLKELEEETGICVISVRVQTQSIAINPTVALGEGQGEASSPRTDRLDQLERLQKLLESGILTREEFDSEKLKILSGV